MAATPEMLTIAREVKPDLVTLVPEKRQELTTEGGLEVAGNQDFLKNFVQDLKEVGLRVSLFVDPVTAADRRGQGSGGRVGGAPHRHLRRRPYPGRSHPALPGTAQRRPARPEHRPEGEVRPRPQLPEYQALPGPGGVRRVLHRPRIMARAILVGIERAVREMVELIRW